MKITEGVPNMHHTAQFHDALIDYIDKKTGRNDEFINLITMIPCFVVALSNNVGNNLDKFIEKEKKGLWEETKKQLKNPSLYRPTFSPFVIIKAIFKPTPAS